MYLIYALLWLVTDGLVSRLKYNVLQHRQQRKIKRQRDRKKVSVKIKKKREKEEDWLITQNQQRPQELRSDPRNNEGLNEAVTCLPSWPLATCTGLAKLFGRFSSSFTATTTSVQRITFTLYSLITSKNPFGEKNYKVLFLTYASCIYTSL